ncbi:polyphosphate kinase 1 [Flagellimonas beolgyonensis]|uniref:polyphosphate kinase 1 n=1 Tax=Flagellimonas beolgyonensis TaxID=864064 RepID=UPI003D648353
MDDQEKRTIDRDIDWLAFNERVLQEAEDTKNPIYERIKFMAIFSSNLDEFFRVRVSKLRQVKRLEKRIRKRLALKPNRLLKEIFERVDAQQERLGRIYGNSILPGLADHGIFLVEPSEASAEQLGFMQDFFEGTLVPRLQTLVAVEANRESFRDGELYLVTSIAGEPLHFLSVPIPELGRFVAIPSQPGTHCYVFIEDIVKHFCKRLFPSGTFDSVYALKISRDAELYLDDEYHGQWMEQVYKSLELRLNGQPTRLLHEGDMSSHLLKALRKVLGIGKIDMVKGGRHHNFSDFFGFPDPLGDPVLKFEVMPPLVHGEFERSDDFFDLIRKKDRILHFPYHRFGYLESWVEQASQDMDVIRIQISLYRIARDSKLTESLLLALDQGKEVIIFVEAKARFDEENNIKWGRIFEERGAIVFYSFPNVKVHSKILLIDRQEEKQVVSYAYIGTGNFNAKTAKLYCDHGLFTSNKQLTEDLAQVFKVLRRKVILPLHKHLLVSPYTSRLGFEHLIQKEMENAQKGLPSGITIKMNSLEDKDMIDWLYRAGAAGVPIRLLIRGFCCLLPQVPGLSENIHVTSIVDRFLEHGRIFLFHNNGKERMYMGSADWMTRNLDRRIEVIAPIADPDVFKELKTILELQLSDNVKARYRDANGNNEYVKKRTGDTPIRSQYEIYRYLKSLHGTPLPPPLPL